MICLDPNYCFLGLRYGTTDDGGVGPLSFQWMDLFWDWWVSYDHTIKRQQLSWEDVALRCDLTKFPNLKLYAMPGGDAYYMQYKLGRSGKENIKAFLANGGAYYGAGTAPPPLPSDWILLLYLQYAHHSMFLS